MESDHEASVAHCGDGSGTDRVMRRIRDRNRYTPADTWQKEARGIIAERFGIEEGGGEDCGPAAEGGSECSSGIRAAACGTVAPMCVLCKLNAP